MLADSLTQQKVTVERNYETLPPLECAAAHLNQVFLNLLMNALQAIEATGRGSGRLRVATRASGDEILIEIGDDGCGIPPEVLPRIFDPFFTTKTKGTGLGMAIAKRIVEAHGGRIGVGPNAAAGGAEIVITLPREPC